MPSSQNHDPLTERVLRGSKIELSNLTEGALGSHHDVASFRETSPHPFDIILWRDLLLDGIRDPAIANYLCRYHWDTFDRLLR